MKFRNLLPEANQNSFAVTSACEQVSNYPVEMKEHTSAALELVKYPKYSHRWNRKFDILL